MRKIELYYERSPGQLSPEREELLGGGNLDQEICKDLQILELCLALLV